MINNPFDLKIDFALDDETELFAGVADKAVAAALGSQI